MNKGFTLIEMVLVVIVLAILSGFAFSAIRSYSELYADTRGGYVYGEAAAVLERITRELRDAGDVDKENPANFAPPTYTASYINFSLTHGTPQGRTTLTPPYWVQYCTCSNAGRRYLYRVQNTSKYAANYCQGDVCPSANDQSIMSRNILTVDPDDPATPTPGFKIRYVQGNPTPAGDSFEITLKLASVGSPRNSIIRLVTRVSPRNYSGLSTGRSFSGGYYDEIN
jgi:prepilin-type N-terminal cleavage/methylation domain-containing protein